MFKRLLRWLGPPGAKMPAQAGGRGDARKLRGRFDAASSLPETSRHWANADSMAADAAASASVRATVRQRARYERFNNPYLCGALRTQANDVVGIGPALQMQTPDEPLNSAAEQAVLEWGEEIGLARKLRMMREVAASDGELFGRIIRNRGLKGPIKLDLTLIEADQCTSPNLGLEDSSLDGIELDADGNVIAYWFLRAHPGSYGMLSLKPTDYVRVPAEAIIHYFRHERPGQHRGIPEVISSLNLHAQRRGFRESVTTAARAAACLGAVILESEVDPNVEPDPIEPFSSIELEHGMMTQAPYGTKPYQLRPEQPSTTYTEFDKQLIREQARPLNMPFNVAAADSSDYNYASGRLDHQTYDGSIQIERAEIELISLRPLIQQWAIEATGIRGYLPERAARKYLPTLMNQRKRVPCAWIWGERGHVDPTKGANAMNTLFGDTMTTHSVEYARKRRDWRTEFNQAGREREALDSVGLLQLEPQLAPQVLNLLKIANTLPPKVVEDSLILLGVPATKAREMAREFAKQDTAAPEPPTEEPTVNRNGNGQMGGVRYAGPI